MGGPDGQTDSEVHKHRSGSGNQRTIPGENQNPAAGYRKTPPEPTGHLSPSVQALLRELSSSVSVLSERLDSQASLSAQPEALRRRLQETGEIRSELERRRAELCEAERLCQELSAIVAEPYLKEELRKRLEGVSAPLRSLEERAGPYGSEEVFIRDQFL